MAWRKIETLSVNEYAITDVFEFADKIHSIPMHEEDFKNSLIIHKPNSLSKHR